MVNKKILNTPLSVWVLFFISIPVFKYLPQIDLYISSLFYQDEIFFFKNTFIEQMFYKSIRPVVALSFLIPIGLFFYSRYMQKDILNITKKKLIFILLALSLVPGAIVQYGFKENFERPRPRQVVEFGGTQPFYPAYTFTNENGKSFSSGHVAAAFSLLGFGLLARSRKRLWMTIIFSYAVGMMIARVAAGAHFFSDVVTSFFIVFIGTNILYTLMIKNSKENEK